MHRKRVYFYRGPVLDYFGNIIDHYWEAETTATSSKRALSNLSYRYSKMYQRPRVSLPGELIERSE